MSEEKMMRLGQIARKLNVGTATIVESMAKRGFEVENNPNSKISMDQVSMLEKEFKSSALDKEEASHLSIGKRHEPISLEPDPPKQEKALEPAPAPVHKEEPKPAAPAPISAPAPDPTPAPVSAPAPTPDPIPEKVVSEAPKLEGIKILGKIDLTKKPTSTSNQGHRSGHGQKPGHSQHSTQKQEKPQEPRKHAPSQQTKPAQTPPKPAPAPAPTSAPVPTNTPDPTPEVPKAPVVVAPQDQVISAKADSLKGLTVWVKLSSR